MKKSLDGIRLEKVQEMAERLLNALELRIKSADAGEWAPQAYKHISATLKDIKELFMLRSDADAKEQQLKIRQLERQVREAEALGGPVTVRILSEEEYSE